MQALQDQPYQHLLFYVLFASVAHFVFLRDVWIRTLKAAVASGRASNLATHLPAELLGHPLQQQLKK
jgi:hypothetical protein